MTLTPAAPAATPDGGSSDTLTVHDGRTGRVHAMPIVHGAIRAADLGTITDASGAPLLTYDPGFMTTAAVKSAVTLIDGDAGILRYRGYPIEEVAERCGFLETAWLLLDGELPSADQLEGWRSEITHHTFIHENVKKFIDGFRHDAHPMGMLMSTVAALATFYPEAASIADASVRRKQIVRLIAKIPTIAAFAYRHAVGLPYVYPDNELSYTGNFLSMMWKTTELRYRPDPVLERALEVLFILHADHEQNCSTSTVRAIGSSRADPYSAVAGGIGALSGPLHGGANEQVLRMLEEIGSVDRVPEHIARVKRGELRLMGFGHRVYKNHDPRARLIKRIADEVFTVTGRSPLLDVALELERVALEDDYFISHRLYPNVDFYSGLIYRALGFPTAMFPVLFAIGRMPGWLTQWEEGVLDGEQKIARPRQLYTGRGERHLPTR